MLVLAAFIVSKVSNEVELKKSGFSRPRFVAVV